MWTQFLLENAHFAVNLFAALSFFSVFWLYADSWVDRKTFKEGLKITGFLILSFAFLASAATIESGFLSSSNLVFGTLRNISVIFKVFGYLFVTFGIIADPISKKPALHAAFFLTVVQSLIFLVPVFSASTAWFYLNRATYGLENHLKKVSIAFFLFSFYEILNTIVLFSNSNNVSVFELVRPFGPIWITALIVEMLAAFALIKWAFFYLLKRINTQLFIISTTAIISIFLTTTVSFTFILFRNLESEALERVGVDASVLTYAIESKKSETLSVAEIIAADSEVSQAIIDGNKTLLNDLSETFLVEKKLSSVLIINSEAKILARGEDRNLSGDSLSDDSLVKRVLLDKSLSAIDSSELSITPNVNIKSGVPVKADGKIIGMVMVASTLDNNFLDGIKAKTGLTASVYSQDMLSATTIENYDGKSRPIGILEKNKYVTNSVLSNSKSVNIKTSILNTWYFGSYNPLLDVDGVPVGMIFVGREAYSVFAIAARSIETTFIVAISLIVLSVLPSFGYLNI